jgi:hypothetical protein
MSTTSDSAVPTVRPRASWKAHKAFYAVVFVLTGAAVYQWGRLRADRPGLPQGHTATATVRGQIALPAADPSGQTASAANPQEIREHIQSQANVARAVRELGASITPLPGEDSEAAFERAVCEVQQAIRVEAGRTDQRDEAQVAIACAHPHPEYAVLVANALAEHYASDCRAAWKANVNAGYLAARQTSDRVRQEFAEAKDRLEAFFEKDQQRKAARRAENRPKPPPPPPPPEPKLADDPEWAELSAQLQMLKRHRTALLVDRTPEHPAVKDTEVRIDELKRRLATMRRWTAAPESEAPPQPPAVAQTPPTQPEENTAAEFARQEAEAAEEFRRLQAVVDRTAQARDAANDIERQTWQACLRQPRIEVELAQACQAPAPAGSGVGLVLAALVGGVAAAFGVGMVATGVSMEPTLTTIAEAEALLPVPVVGVIPSDDPPADPPAVARRQRLTRLATIVGGLLALVGCVVIAWLAGG